MVARRFVLSTGSLVIVMPAVAGVSLAKAALASWEEISVGTSQECFVGTYSYKKLTIDNILNVKMTE